MRVLAIDPGETTGYAGALVENQTFQLTALGSWKGLEGCAKMCDTLFSGEAVPALVVVEEYVVYASHLQQHTFSKVYTAREIGRIELYAHKAKSELVYQLAAVAKQRWPTSRLRRHFNWSPGFSVHALDALRHLFSILERRKLAKIPFKGEVI